MKLTVISERVDELVKVVAALSADQRGIAYAEAAQMEAGRRSRGDGTPTWDGGSGRSTPENKPPRGASAADQPTGKPVRDQPEPKPKTKPKQGASPHGRTPAEAPSAPRRFRGSRTIDG